MKKESGSMTKKNSYITIDDLRKMASTYITNSGDLDKITSAYEYAKEKHFGEKWLTNQDYIEHPLQVAYILAEISADTEKIGRAHV